jgi:hypothetical protein
MGDCELCCGEEHPVDEIGGLEQVDGSRTEDMEKKLIKMLWTARFIQYPSIRIKICIPARPRCRSSKQILTRWKIERLLKQRLFVKMKFLFLFKSGFSI